MLTKKTFKEQMVLLSKNFNFTANNDYLGLIYYIICDKTTDELFVSRIKNIIMSKKLKDWNEQFGYQGKPAVADAIEMFCVQRLKIPCKPYEQFGATVSHRLETYNEALVRIGQTLINNA